MTVLLPDEILTKIAKACVEPWGFNTKPAPGNSSKRTFKGLPGLLNVKLVNKLFYDEVWTAIRDGFDGRLDLTGCEDKALEALTTNKDAAAWLMPLVTSLELFDGWDLDLTGHQPLNDLVTANLVKLKNLTFRKSSVAYSAVSLDDCLTGGADSFVKSITLSSSVYFEWPERSRKILRDRGVHINIIRHLIAKDSSGTVRRITYSVAVMDNNVLEITTRVLGGAIRQSGEEAVLLLEGLAHTEL